ANAYASDGEKLLLTDWLLRHLSPREVDAIIAHELAHMKCGHVPKLSWLTVLLCVPIVAWLRLKVKAVPDLEWVVLSALVLIHLAGLISKVLSRRFEDQADLEAVKIIGDPEALVTALVCLGQLNAMPHTLSSLDKAFSTHPSTRRRIEAIGKAGGIE